MGTTPLLPIPCWRLALLKVHPQALGFSFRSFVCPANPSPNTYRASATCQAAHWTRGSASPTLEVPAGDLGGPSSCPPSDLMRPAWPSNPLSCLTSPLPTPAAGPSFHFPKLPLTPSNLCLPTGASSSPWPLVLISARASSATTISQPKPCLLSFLFAFQVGHTPGVNICQWPINQQVLLTQSPNTSTHLHNSGPTTPQPSHHGFRLDQAERLPRPPASTSAAPRIAPPSARASFKSDHARL